MDLKNNFASKILYLRKTHQLSLSALGNAVGISNQAISLLEQGKRSPSFEVLIALADYFDVSIDYLVGRSEEPKIHK
ncbi:MAG: helix-turn-helix domain-containing protein [Firmicutes bacterium]|nr:helix-turn-helix domain-containing protein [Bacillota bacterium]